MSPWENYVFCNCWEYSISYIFSLMLMHVFCSNFLFAYRFVFLVELLVYLRNLSLPQGYEKFFWKFYSHLFMTWSVLSLGLVFMNYVKWFKLSPSLCLSLSQSLLLPLSVLILSFSAANYWKGYLFLTPPQCQLSCKSSVRM